MRLEDLYRAVLADYALKGNRSSKNVTIRFRAMLAYWGATKRADEITFDIIQAYAHQRIEKDKMAPGTVQLELRYLHRGFKLFHLAGKLSVPPFPSIRVDNARQTFFEDNEAEAVIKLLPWDLQPMILFLWYTGWRHGTAKALQWKDVDFPRLTVTQPAHISKNKRQWTFPFADFPQLRTLLEEQRRKTEELERREGKIIPWVFWRDCGPTWRTKGGRRIGRIDGAWHTACTKAGYPGRIPHDFRRSATRRFDEAGVRRVVAKKLLGTITDSMYERYNIAPQKDQESGARKYARSWRKKPPCQGDQIPS